MATELRSPRLKIGQLWIDALTFPEALERIEALVSGGRGGGVFTPNVDHVVNVEHDPAFRAAYDHAALSLVDGTPLLWASRLLGMALPEKISGSDLVMPLMERAGARGWKVYLLGGEPGVGEKAAAVFRERFGVQVVGIDAPRVNLADPENLTALVERARAAKPDLVLVALGSPKQELLIDRMREQLRPAVALGIGASLDFVAGTVKRAPRWMSKAGLEWSYRLAQEPGRMWRRYLVNDPKFLLILLRTLKIPIAERTTRG